MKQLRPLAFWSLAALLLQICGVTHALRAVRISVPRVVLAGQRATMSCTYDLEGAALYSTRWYRNMEEFYRYVPKEEPPTRVFPLSGINVDVNDSDDRRVTLINVKRELAGEYQCEVSADAPLFHTEIKGAEMIVVEVPDEDPYLSLDKTRYTAGDKVKANCSTGLSYPAANITWFVNEQKVPETIIISVFTSPDNLSSSIASLDLDTDQLGSSSVNKLRLRCEASLYDVYKGSSITLEVREDRPLIASVLGHSTSGSSRSNPLLFLLLLLLTAAHPHLCLLAHGIPDDER